MLGFPAEGDGTNLSDDNSRVINANALERVADVYPTRNSRHGQGGTANTRADDGSEARLSVKLRILCHILFYLVLGIWLTRVQDKTVQYSV